MKNSTLIGALAALLMVAGIFSYFQLRHRPKKELQLTVAALRDASSWHEEYDGPGEQPGTWQHTTSDMVCPQGQHVIVDETGVRQDLAHRELFDTATKSYYRWPNQWVQLNGFNGVKLRCSSRELDAVGILEPLGDLLATASVRAEGERMAGGEPCRDYRVTSPWREFVICVNPDDHLPREVVSSKFKDESGQMLKPERASYSKWNIVSVSDFPADAPRD